MVIPKVCVVPLLWFSFFLWLVMTIYCYYSFLKMPPYSIFFKAWVIFLLSHHLKIQSLFRKTVVMKTYVLTWKIQKTAIIFKIIQSTESCEKNISKIVMLFKAIAILFVHGDKMIWRKFYPLMKSFLFE